MTEVTVTERIETEAHALTTMSMAVRVIDAESYEAAGERLLDVKAYRKGVADHFDPHIKNAHRAHKALLADKKKHDQPAIDAERRIKSAMLEWRKAEDARAEAERAAAEAAARAEAEAQQLAHAAELEAAGEPEAAEAVLDAPTPVAPVAKRKAAPKVKGVSIRKVWTFEVVDAAKIPRQFLTIDESKIGQVVRAMKGEAEKLIPGIRVIAQDSMAAGR